MKGGAELEGGNFKDKICRYFGGKKKRRIDREDNNIINVLTPYPISFEASLHE